MSGKFSYLLLNLLIATINDRTIELYKDRNVSCPVRALAKSFVNSL